MITQLIDKVLEYNPAANVKKIREAYELAENNHKGQLRNSGEEYIIHPFHVAMILAEMNMDTATIIAGQTAIWTGCCVTCRWSYKIKETKLPNKTRKTSRKHSKNGSGYGKRYSSNYCKVC